METETFVIAILAVLAVECAIRLRRSSDAARFYREQVAAEKLRRESAEKVVKSQSIQIAALHKAMSMSSFKRPRQIEATQKETQ